MADGASHDRWYTATDLAGLPGLPGTQRGINKAAEREGWKRRQRMRGKGWEYAVVSLPLPTQMALGSDLASATVTRLRADLVRLDVEIGALLAVSKFLHRRLRGSR